MICFRCGICCELYQAPVDRMEAARLAEGLGILLAQFCERYCDPRWPGTDNHILRHENGACVFLERNGPSTTCKVHLFRPNACRQWQAGPDKKECRDGLNREWGLSITPSGEWTGCPEKLAEFQLFINRSSRA